MNGWGKGISEIENLKTYHASEKHKSFGGKKVYKQTDKHTNRQKDRQTKERVAGLQQRQQQFLEEETKKLNPRKQKKREKILEARE